ncbi:MAG: serine/threonine-protein kinase [Zavarzinella sp.]
MLNPQDNEEGFNYDLKEIGPISDPQDTIILANQSTLPDILPHEINSALPDIGSMLNDFIRIEGVIAHARHSIVYKAFHQKLGMEVAVKMPNLQDAQQIYVLQSFYENEVSILAKLIHNNISRIVYFDQFNDLPYIVTQYVEGKSLTEVMKAHQMQPQVGYCLKVASTTLSALNFAWKRGIIHRDIKPDNLICRPDGQLTVIDWGLAAERDEYLPVHSERNMYRYLGCPAFQAPELARPGGRFDSRADIYSLGAMMYFLVTGKYPFNYTKVEQVLYAHLHYEPIPPHELVAKPGMLKLSDLIMRMMAKNPNHRPSIREMQEEFTLISEVVAQPRTRYLFGQ